MEMDCIHLMHRGRNPHRRRHPMYLVWRPDHNRLTSWR